MSDDIVWRLRHETFARDLAVCEEAAHHIEALRAEYSYWYLRWHQLETAQKDHPE